jgi:YbbR domain-containing protein
MAIDVAPAIRSVFTENIGLKILSFLFAIVLFSLVHGSQDAQRSMLLAVVVLTPPETANRVLMTQMPAQLRVTLRGPRSQLDDLHADDMGSVQVDLRNGTETRVTFERSMIPVAAGLQVEQIDPPAIDLVWEDRIVRDVPVQVSVVGTPAPGFVVKGVPVADPSVVRARGPRSEVMVVQHARGDAFDVSGLTEGKYQRTLAIDRPPGRVTYDASNVSASIEITREVVERPFPKVAVAVLGNPKAKAQPAEIDVRLACPPEIVRALRPEQIVPRVQIATASEHGTEALPVDLSIDKCEVHITPPTVVVRW